MKKTLLALIIILSFTACRKDTSLGNILGKYNADDNHYIKSFILKEDGKVEIFYDTSSTKTSYTFDGLNINFGTGEEGGVYYQGKCIQLIGETRTVGNPSYYDGDGDGYDDDDPDIEEFSSETDYYDFIKAE